MAAAVSLSEMVDLAIGSPEVGSVNFAVLHGLLHAVLVELGIGGVKAELPAGEDPANSSPNQTSPATSNPRKAQTYPDQDARRISNVGSEASKDSRSDSPTSGGSSRREDSQWEKPGVSREEDALDDGKPRRERPRAENSLQEKPQRAHTTDDAENRGRRKNDDDRVIPAARPANQQQIADRVDSLEKKWEELHALPSNKELLGRALGSGDKDKGRPIAEMWQGMQLAKKVDANTNGVNKVRLHYFEYSVCMCCNRYLNLGKVA